jgi:hypothetical protein
MTDFENAKPGLYRDGEGDLFELKRVALDSPQRWVGRWLEVNGVKEDRQASASRSYVEHVGFVPVEDEDPERTYLTDKQILAAAKWLQSWVAESALAEDDLLAEFHLTLGDDGRARAEVRYVPTTDRTVCVWEPDGRLDLSLTE